jgi:hypothetical protein
MTITLNFSVTVAVLAFLAATGFQPALATSLACSDGIRVDAYLLPGVNRATITNFENAASIDWKAKLKTKHGVTTGTASLDATCNVGISCSTEMRRTVTRSTTTNTTCMRTSSTTRNRVHSCWTPQRARTSSRSPAI